MQRELPALTSDEGKNLPWLALKHVKGLGCVSFKRIVDHLGNPRRVFSIPDEDLARIPGLEARVIEGLRSFSDWDRMRTEMDQLAELGATMISYDHENSPPALAPDARPEAKTVFELVKQSPLQIDEVIEATGLSSAQVSEIL